MERPQVLPLASSSVTADTRLFVEMLYLHSSNRVFAFLRYRVHDPAIAEELTARTFERVLEHAGTYRAQGSEDAWLFTIARNVLVDYLRKNRVRVVAPLLETLPDASPGPEELLLLQECFQALAEALSALPERMQTALSLKYGAGLLHLDIGRVLRMPEKQVGVLLHRARQKIKHRLDKEAIR